MRHFLRPQSVSIGGKVPVTILSNKPTVTIQSTTVNIQNSRSKNNVRNSANEHILYHALKEEQSSATYVQDAQQSGDQDLIQFFGEIHQNASRQADRAKQLLSRAGS